MKVIILPRQAQDKHSEDSKSRPSAYDSHSDAAAHDWSCVNNHLAPWLLWRRLEPQVTKEETGLDFCLDLVQMTTGIVLYQDRLGTSIENTQ